MFRRRRSADDFAQEIQSHLELEADDLAREGLSEDEARRHARVEFGSVRAAEERFYLSDRMEWFDNLRRDLRFALRQMVKNSSFAVTAILVLALGIGASVAIFAFVDSALLQPLPYAHPARLMAVNESSPVSPVWPLSYPDFLDWQQLNRSFTSLAIYSGRGFLLHGASGVEPVQAERISGSFFRTLGVRPVLGRDFNPGEDQLNGPDVAILSYSTWLRRFGARHDVIGQTADLDDRTYTIVGVLPRTFSFAPSGGAEFWVPINSLSPHEQSRTFYPFMGVGRLRDGTTIDAAQAEMTAIARQLQKQYGITGRDLSASVVPLSEFIIGNVRPILLALLGGAILLLATACVNVANLVLLRSESRWREIAVRSALGATPARLVQQFVTEGLLLAGAGGLAGLLIAAGLTHLLTRLVPRDMAASMPFLEGVGFTAHTLSFGVAIALVAALLLAATPILRLSFRKVRNALTGGDRGSSSLLWQRLGANLIVVELAVAVVLLAGAGLLGQSLYRLLHVRLGFDPDHLATLQVMAADTTYHGDEQVTGLYREVVQRISSLPGVKSAGITSMLPVECNCAIDRIHIAGRPDQGEHNEVDERHVSPGYLSALKATLMRGRFFTDADDPSHPRVAVVNQGFARKYFPGENPIGQRIDNDEGGLPSEWEIVGVVNDVREGALDGDIWPAEYFPIAQARQNTFSLAVRTSQDAAAVLPLLVSTLHTIDPSLGLSDEATMSTKVGSTQAALLHRAAAWLVGGFAAVALVLGMVGLYGVISYSVSQRTRELGIRMALGAQRSAVYGLVMLQAGRLIGAGLIFGLVGAVAASSWMRSLLFGVQAWDVLTLGGVAVLLGLVSVAASLLPAHRAAAVNPVEALRSE